MQRTKHMDDYFGSGIPYIKNFVDLPTEETDCRVRGLNLRWRIAYHVCDKIVISVSRSFAAGPIDHMAQGNFRTPPTTVRFLLR